MHHDELWQEYDRAGRRLKTSWPSIKNNPKMNQNAAFVSTVCVWLYRHTEDGIEILFQKRSPYIDSYANLYDRSAGGHVNFGEDDIDAVIRETREEIGVDLLPDNVSFVSSHVSNYKNLIVKVYAYDCTGSEMEFSFDDKEVSEVKWVRLTDFDEFVEQNAKPPLKADTEVNMLFKKWLEFRGNY
ncbi:NUDIX domain-containing protein [Candidatus Saccharibacteria bacterium]|nr:NUDIX domain-containing protein [Candidatus Saccharibacteria bacterium]